MSINLTFDFDEPEERAAEQEAKREKEREDRELLGFTRGSEVEAKWGGAWLPARVHAFPCSPCAAVRWSSASPQNLARPPPRKKGRRWRTMGKADGNARRQSSRRLCIFIFLI